MIYLKITNKSVDLQHSGRFNCQPMLLGDLFIGEFLAAKAKCCKKIMIPTGKSCWTHLTKGFIGKYRPAQQPGLSRDGAGRNLHLSKMHLVLSAQSWGHDYSHPHQVTWLHLYFPQVISTEIPRKSCRLEGKWVSTLYAETSQVRARGMPKANCWEGVLARAGRTPDTSAAPGKNGPREQTDMCRGCPLATKPEKR